ncbi:hypothetical protein DDZ14_08575 [Maritimibacter sp. 55A14]|uniref:hypothetical protein n=1 Tax=Maritimibacter sp. 55A14 TaxID=2174844 RepID=UPI000D61C651|nr:hypothetical protein [Maritimibacter sp. 55A14]PWE32791.1 hypothetical protein DDZ14_08575 [Maritimibacter sp. 55A14]
MSVLEPFGHLDSQTIRVPVKVNTESGADKDMSAHTPQVLAADAAGTVIVVTSWIDAGDILIDVAPGTFTPGLYHVQVRATLGQDTQAVLTDVLEITESLVAP